MNFGGKEKQVSPETFDELLTAAKQLQKDDPEGACQILLVCAVYQNYAGRRDKALVIMQQMLALAEQHALSDELLWAAWGACAVCYQAGDFEQAAGYLQRLQTLLHTKNEWMLANYVETVAQALHQQANTPGEEELESPSDLEHMDLMHRTFDWLDQWGFSAQSPLPEFQPALYSIEHMVPRGPIFSGQRWKGYWRFFKRVASGEMKLRWVPNGVHSPVNQKNQQRPPHFDLPKLKQSEPLQSFTGRTVVQDLLRPEGTDPSQAVQIHAEESLLCYCLGSFRVYKNDLLIEKWPGNKCKQILKYMVIHRNKPVNQEVLMELFWPGMDLKGARRNLYQAIYSLRQALQGDDTDYPYVLTEDNHYRLNPELDLWVDSEAFDLHYHNAQNLVASGSQEEGIEEFQRAEILYQGEFLAEDRYEDWPLVYRENLKNAYLDALDQLSQHFYTNHQFAMSIDYCRKILGEDNCREDVHRRVMLCYLSLGQSNLALRQYHACVEALREELEVPPMPATEELYEQIRQKRDK